MERFPMSLIGVQRMFPDEAAFADLSYPAMPWPEARPMRGVKLRDLR